MSSGAQPPRLSGRASLPHLRGFSLNGGQLIGIVLSVAWSVGAVIYEVDARNDRYDAAFSEAFNLVYEECRRQQDLDVDNGRNSRDCAQEAERVAMAVHPEPRWPVAFVALAPIPIAWLLVWGLVAQVRWVRRGLQP
jgi:hypothetical protein